MFASNPRLCKIKSGMDSVPIIQRSLDLFIQDLTGNQLKMDESSSEKGTGKQVLV